MKKIIVINLLLLFQNFYGQNENFDKKELNVSVKSIHYNFNKVGGQKDKYGFDDEKLDILYDIFIYINIDGFDIEHPIDFNNFSLVEIENKLRQRPFLIGFRYFELTKVDLKDFRGEDNFLKYSQEGITNYDHYYREFYTPNPRQQRFYPLKIPLKKNKSKEFVFRFPVKSKDQGEFSLFYKNNLVKTFFLERGKTLKY